MYTKFVVLCKDSLAAQGMRRYDGKQPEYGGQSTRRVKIVWLLKASVVMTGNNQNMVDRPSLSFTARLLWIIRLTTKKSVQKILRVKSKLLATKRGYPILVGLVMDRNICLMMGLIVF